MVWALLVVGMLIFKVNATSHFGLKLSYPLSIGLNYDYIMKNGLAITGNFGIMREETTTWSIPLIGLVLEEEETVRISFAGGVKKYLHEEKWERGGGAYFGGTLGMINYRVTKKLWPDFGGPEDSGFVNVFTLAGLAGYRWVWGGFALGFETGLVYSTAAAVELKAEKIINIFGALCKVTLDEKKEFKSRIDMTAALSLGFVF